MTTWRVRATGVRRHENGLRWTVQAFTDDLDTTVTADTTYAGTVVELQSDGYAGTTGDDALYFEVTQHIADVLSLRTVLQSLDAIDRERFGRVQQPTDRTRWAA